MTWLGGSKYGVRTDCEARGVLLTSRRELRQVAVVLDMARLRRVGL